MIISSIIKESIFGGAMREKKHYYREGIGFGAALAMVISYTTWTSIPWAIVHGLLGWIYVVYFAIFH